MGDVLTIFADSLLPVILVSGTGFWLRRQHGVDKTALSRVVFYVLSPALVLDTLTSGEFAGRAALHYTWLAASSMLVMGLIGWGLGRALKLDRAHTAILILAAMFANTGNLGIPINELQFGQEGMVRAVYHTTLAAVFVFTVGTVVVSAENSSLRQIVTRLVQLPIIWAIMLSAGLALLHISLPRPLARAVGIGAQGTVPVMLLILGMNIADIHHWPPLRLAVPAIFLRLVVAPALVWGLALLTGASLPDQNTLVAEMAMPVAVVVIVLTTEYDTRPDLMAGVVGLTTFVSPLTLTVILGLLSK